MIIALNMYINQILRYKLEGFTPFQITKMIADDFELTSNDLINEIYNFAKSI